MPFTAVLRKWSLPALILILGLPLMSPSFAEDKKDEPQQITLNLKNTDIRTLIETMAEISGKNFIIDPRVKGNVTVVSSSPVTPEQAYDIFVSVLKVHGFAIIPSGNVHKVILSTSAKQDSVPTQQGVGDNLITKVISIEYAESNQLVPLLKPLMPPHAHLAAHNDSNTLVITDSAGNIKRIEEVISQLDISIDNELETIALKNTQASQLVIILESLTERQLSGKQARKRDKNRIIADDRTNSLILKGENDWRRKIKRLVRQLDKPTNQDDYTEVVFLRHANAANLVEVLRGVGNQQLKNNELKSEQSGSDKTFDIQADKSTNSLVITAPAFLSRSLKAVIEKLDIRRSQVHIQAIIAEVKYDKAVELGVEWSSSIPGEGTIAKTKLPLAGSVTSSIETFPGTVGSGFSLGHISGGTLRGLIKAFATDGDTNILSTPSIVTLDNEEARIHVGQNVPFVTGQFTSGDSEGGQNPFQTIEREDIGIKLKVRPHINEGETIELNIEQEVSTVDTTSTVDGLVTNKRLIDTTVLVDDEEIIVLGGLIEDEIAESTSKVPLLGDVPVLGHLFRSQRTTKDKRNLMVFLRPQIIRDSDDIKNITRKDYTRMQDLQRQLFANGVQLMPKENKPILPDFDKNPASVWDNPFMEM